MIYRTFIFSNLSSGRPVCALQKEYLTLVEQCMNFACQMMDLCRGTQEVEAVISEYMDDGEKVKDPLGRLRMAIRYEEKKVSLKVSFFLGFSLFP